MLDEMQIDVVAATDAGRRRKINADAFLVDEAAGLFAVADGMGDTPRSGVVARMALDAVRELFTPRVSFAAALMRLLVLPACLLLVARYLPCSVEFRRVLVIQAAMPAAVIPVIMARFYGGHPRTAVQIVLTTTAVGIVTIPLWLRFGMAWAMR